MLLGVALLVLAALPAMGAPPPATERTVVVLLFDGWAPALLDTAAAPTLARLRDEGAWSHHLLPAFPSVSLVNQVTVSTGCWPEKHGIISNEFLDPERGRYDHSRDADWLTGCEHLHQVAERQGVRTAVLGWVGGYSTRRGDLATYVSPERAWPDFPDDEHRAQQVIELLQRPDDQRPRLILAYFRGPDSTEHLTGMDSEATRQAVADSDAAVGAILNAIQRLPFRDQVTLIVTTDHGMLPVWMNVNVDKILRNNDIQATAVSSGTTSFVYLSDASKAGDAARKLAAYRLYFDVFSRYDQPADWHLGRGPRVPDLVLSAQPPNVIEDVRAWPWWSRWLARWGPEVLWARPAIKAAHGYRPTTPGMSGIVYAWGAGIAPGREVERLEAIDIHPTVCRLLSIEPGRPVNGAVATQLLDEGSPQ
jgi:predicted AlkP superfamily pyrophosphatase or phosphodiesterase